MILQCGAASKLLLAAWQDQPGHTRMFLPSEHL